MKGQELELDLVTFSPELKLQVARVESRDEASLRLVKLKRPVEAWVDEESGLEGEAELTVGLGELERYRLVPDTWV